MALGTLPPAAFAAQTPRAQARCLSSWSSSKSLPAPSSSPSSSSTSLLLGAAAVPAAEVLRRQAKHRSARPRRRSRLRQPQYPRRSVRAFCASSPIDRFDELDANGDGFLSREEFLAGQRDPQKNKEVLKSQAVASMGLVLEEKLEAFKGYLIFSEETGPLPYRVTESFFVALGTLCFVTRVVSPGTAGDFFLQEVEDFVNVSFFVKFLLLFWINEFRLSWLFTGKGALDMASSLPVLCIPARLIGGPALERTTDLLQIGRFLRLLRVALPSDSDAGPGGVVIRTVPVSQQIIAVLLSLLGTVVVSATVLYSFENPDTPDPNIEAAERSFEDALIYMVNIFAGRDPPWYPLNPQAKIASVVATTSGIIFIPFLVARSVELFMKSDGDVNGSAANTVMAARGLNASSWAEVLECLDLVEQGGYLQPEEMRQLRRLCLERDDRLGILHTCYAKRPVARKQDRNLKLYASRLQELLEIT